ncbi:MAG TPA: tetratricopeptide repeat protein [Thermoanaerobaculia bacterium]|nr:tetratricopeptide repeat protein [Thermoanaerobaculia bacterium]
MRSKGLLFAMLLLTASSLFGSRGTSMPPADPKNEALNSYNDGLRYRDRAWNYEKELAATTDAAKRAKLEEQIRKTYAAEVRCQRAAIKNNPQLFQAYSELGYALRKSGDYPGALEAYDKALSLMPNYAEAIEYRGEAFLGLDRVADAREAYLLLFNGGDKNNAGLLAAAMSKWVGAHRASPGSVPSQTIDEFAAWLTQRKEISHETAAGGSWR